MRIEIDEVLKKNVLSGMNSNLEIRSQYPVLKVPGSRPSSLCAMQGETISASPFSVKNFFQNSLNGLLSKVSPQKQLGYNTHLSPIMQELFLYF